MEQIVKNRQYLQFCLYGFLKNLRFYDVFFLLFFLDQGLTFLEIGMLYATREITTNIFEVASGIVADAFGRKRALILAFACYLMAFGIFYFAFDFQFLFFGMFLFGVADAFRSGSHKGMIMDYLQVKGWSDQKVAYYGHTRSYSQLGSALSAILSGLVVFAIGDYRIVFLMAVFPYLLNFINIWTYPDHLNFPIKEKSKRPSFQQIWADFILSIRKKPVFKIMNSAALHSAYLKSLKDYIQPLLIQVSLIMPWLLSFETKQKNGLIVGVAYFFIFLLSSFASRYASKVLNWGIASLHSKTLYAGLFAGVVSGLFAYYDFPLWSLLFFVLIYLIENLRKPILTGSLADEVEPEILTSVISAQSFYGTVMTTVLVIFLGFFADTWGVGLAIFLMSGLLFVYSRLVALL